MARPPKSKPPAAVPPAEAAEQSADLAPVVGKNLKRLRTERGLSLERLAQSSGVSRAMLGQVELGLFTWSKTTSWLCWCCLLESAKITPHIGQQPSALNKQNELGVDPKLAHPILTF